MIKIGMCDDNLNGIMGIKYMIDSQIIEKGLDAEITMVTDNQQEIFDAIYNKELDVLFLDIDFKGNGKNGIDFAKDLRQHNKDFYLVFLTAHQRYMHISFFVKVFDYLIKPVNKYVIEELVCRLKDEFQAKNNIFLHLNRWNLMRIDEILYIEKVGNKSIIYTENSKQSTYKTLDSLLKELPTNFKRCHKSYIVNENKVSSIDKKNGYIFFSEKLYCPISTHFELR